MGCIGDTAIAWLTVNMYLLACLAVPYVYFNTLKVKCHIGEVLMRNLTVLEIFACSLFL